MLRKKKKIEKKRKKRDKKKKQGFSFPKVLLFHQSATKA